MPIQPYNGPQYQYMGPNAYGPYPTVPMQPTFQAPQTQTQPQPPIQTTTLPGRVITAAIANAARDIADNQNANYRALHDEIVANRMEDKNAQIAQLQSQVQALNLAQSQANQNSYLLQQLRPCPIPAYTVPNPCATACYSTYQSCGC